MADEHCNPMELGRPLDGLDAARADCLAARQRAAAKGGGGDIDAEHMMADIGEAGAGDETDVTGADGCTTFS